MLKNIVTKKHLTETKSHERLLYAFIIGVVALLISWPLSIGLVAKSLIAWCFSSGCYLILVWSLAIEFNSHRTKIRAQALDQSSLILFVLLFIIVMSSIGSIILMLQTAKGLFGLQYVIHMLISSLALTLSWLLMHTLFAFRYAHRYYRELLNPGPNGGGLEFPGSLDPDYFDFLYYSYVIGMSTQVSDVGVSSRHMRKLTLIHSIIAFAFNMVILAIGINIIAGAI